MKTNKRHLITITTLCASISLGATAAAASTSPTKGEVHVWVTPGKGAVDKILLTGVIADHGSATTTNKDGAVDNNGKYVRIALRHGTFKVDAVPFNKVLDGIRPSVNKADCSFWATGTGNVTLSDGTGAYIGITGTLRMTTSFAAVLPRYTSGPKKGQCNSNANPIIGAEFNGSIIGAGKVSF